MSGSNCTCSRVRDNHICKGLASAVENNNSNNLQYFPDTTHTNLYKQLRTLACSHKTLSRVNYKQNAMETAHRRRDVTRTNKTNYANRTEQV